MCLIAPYQPVVTLHGGVGDNSQWVCPLKLFDYMAAGKPIICSDHPVIRETVEHERDALICAPNGHCWLGSRSHPTAGPSRPLFCHRSQCARQVYQAL